MKNSIQSTLALSLLAGAMVSPAAYAQLEEVVVTAQYREETTMEIPIAVTAFSGDSLEQTGAVELADFLQMAPGVTIANVASGPASIQIRGISSLVGDSTVGYYLDELSFTFFGNSVVPFAGVYDLDRVEVLRGPQPTLYGDGSIGGTIRMITRQPEFNRFSAKADVESATVAHGGSDFSVRGAVNIPILEDKVALRMTVSHDDLAGWIDLPAIDEENVNTTTYDTFRTKLLFAPTENLDVTFAWWRQEQEFGHPSVELDGHINNDTLVTPINTQFDLFSMTLNYETPWFNVVSASSLFELINNQNFAFFGLLATNDEDHDAFTQEIRLTSKGDGPFRWLGGFYYRDLSRSSVFDLTALGIPPSSQLSESESWAVFGEGTYAFFDGALEATAGVRYFEDERVVTDPPYPVVVFKDNTVNPRFNLKWLASDSTQVYFNVAKGFRTSQPQRGISYAAAELLGIELPAGAGPETLWSYEIGSKSTLMDDQLSVEAAVYLNDWTDMQQIIYLTSSLGAGVSAGTAQAIGLEWALNYAPQAVEGLTLGLSGNVNKSEYTESVSDTFGLVVVDGERINNVPKFTLSASADYRWPLAGGNLNGVIYANMQHNTKRVQRGLLETGESDNITLFDARVGVETQDGRYGFFLVGDNLTDEDNSVSVALSNAAFHTTRPRPRTVGVQLRVAWDN